MLAVRWILEIQFLTVLALKRPILHNHAKFREDEDLSILCCDIAICVVFKMTTAAILFFKFEILTVCPLSGANLRHHAKFHQNRSNGCGDMAI